MSGPILSQDEINALLRSDGSEPLQEVLTEVLTVVAAAASQWINRSLQTNIVLGGPYIERLAEDLGQSITEDSFVIAAELEQSELFFLMSAQDAEIFARHLGRSGIEGAFALSETWAGQLGQELVLSYRLFSAQRVSSAYLARLPVEKESLLVRHLISFGRDNLEFCLLIQNRQAQKLRQRSLLVKSSGRSSAVKGSLKNQRSPVTEATFQPLAPPARSDSIHQMALLDDIVLSVIVELGQATMTMNELLELKPQTVIRLERHAGDPVDVYVNDRRAAVAEVVVLEDHFGVRVLEIISTVRPNGNDEG